MMFNIIYMINIFFNMNIIVRIGIIFNYYNRPHYILIQKKNNIISIRSQILWSLIRFDFGKQVQQYHF